jgi:hypothetical protein
MTCYYCRDAATKTAGGHHVCDDCRSSYERQVSKRAEDAKREIKSN